MKTNTAIAVLQGATLGLVIWILLFITHAPACRANDYVKAPDGTYVASSDGTVSDAPDGSWHGGGDSSFTRTPDGAWHGSED